MLSRTAWSPRSGSSRHRRAGGHPEPGACVACSPSGTRSARWRPPARLRHRASFRHRRARDGTGRQHGHGRRSSRFPLVRLCHDRFELPASGGSPAIHVGGVQPIGLPAERHRLATERRIHRATGSRGGCSARLGATSMKRGRWSEPMSEPVSIPRMRRSGLAKAWSIGMPAKPSQTGQVARVLKPERPFSDRNARKLADHGVALKSPRASAHRLRRRRFPQWPARTPPPSGSRPRRARRRAPRAARQGVARAHRKHHRGADGQGQCEVRDPAPRGRDKPAKMGSE